MKSTELQLAELKVRYLAEALDKICREMVQAGMSSYKPDHNEMIEIGAWGLGLINMLEIDVEYTPEVEN